MHNDLAERRIDAYRMGRKRRGDIRIFLLFALSEKPMHGYEIIQFFTEITHGMWIPSQGSVYPTLQLLEDQNLVTSVERDGKRVYSITEAGREQAEALPKGSFDKDPEQLRAITSLREANMTVRHIMKHVITQGSVEELQQAAEIMQAAQKQLARLIDHQEDLYSK